jgi:hypothetical protein
MLEPAVSEILVMAELTSEEGNAMEQSRVPDVEIVYNSDEQRLVHEWRADRLRRLGFRYWEAELFADLVDWHAVADLVARGSPPTLALKILR